MGESLQQVIEHGWSSKNHEAIFKVNYFSLRINLLTVHWNFPASFLVTLLIISLVLVSLTVIIIFLSEVVARGSSSLPFKVQTTSGTGIPWNHSIYKLEQ